MVSILACLAAQVGGLRSTLHADGSGDAPGSCAALWAVLPYLPTYLPTHLLPTYLPSYLPTYRGAGEFLGEGSLGVGLVLAARAHGVHGAREYLHALVDEAAQPVEAARRLRRERLDVLDAR